MKTPTKYPFQLSNSFFKLIQISRVGQLPDPVNLQLETQIRTREQEQPDILQVDFRISTPGNQPVSINIEMVGIFNLIKGEPEQDLEAIKEFVLDRGLFMLWSIMAQLVKQITAQMGMKPLNVVTPSEFFFHLKEDNSDSEEE